MKIMHVTVHIKPEHLDAFIDATLSNGRSTVQEPGNLRFELLRHADSQTTFTLVEIYRDEAAMNAHFETEHFAAWRAATTDVFAEPGSATQYEMVFPEAL